MSETKLEEVKKETVKPSKSVSKPAVKPVSKGAAESSDVILRLENLSKSFGKNRVLSGISLEVKRGPCSWPHGRERRWKVHHDEVPLRDLFPG
jgi:ATPase subunit of ABC transporter with duplicated ATPase domains